MGLLNGRPAPILGALIFFSVFLISSVHYRSLDAERLPPPPSTAQQMPLDGKPSPAAAVTTTQPQRTFKYNHVALATTFGAWHHDVLVPIGHSMEQALGRNDSVRLYVPQPYHLGDFGFDDVVNRTGIFHGGQFSHHTMYDDMYKTDLFPGSPGAMIDLVVLGTCEYDMDHWSRQLLDVWDRRPADKKFSLACIIHEVSDKRSFMDLQEWGIRGALRYLTISDHVSLTIRQYLHKISEGQNSEAFYSMVEYANIDSHIPVLPLPDPVRPLKGQRKLTRAVIQGLMDPKRRDYTGVLKDLAVAIKEPEGMGIPCPNGEHQGIHSHTSNMVNNPPFELHIVGTGWIYDIPHELSHVIKFHRDLQYWDYYELMQGMDVVLPAFAHDEYYDVKASSTVAMAIQCNVPMLVTRRFLASYLYAADDRITIVRPHGLREVHALQALRSGVFPPPAPAAGFEWVSSYASIHHRYANRLQGRAKAQFESDVKRMLELGWERSNEQFAEFKEILWEKNRVVVRKMLDDI